MWRGWSVLSGSILISVREKLATSPRRGSNSQPSDRPLTELNESLYPVELRRLVPGDLSRPRDAVTEVVSSPSTTHSICPSSDDVWRTPVLDTSQRRTGFSAASFTPFSVERHITRERFGLQLDQNCIVTHDLFDGYMRFSTSTSGE